jgi:WD40 repeat protein
VRRLDGHKGEVRAVAFTRDGRVVSGGADRTVRVWDPFAGECVAVVKAKGPVYAVAAAPDGSAVVFAGRPPSGADVNVVTAIDPATGKPTGKYEQRTEDDVARWDNGAMQLAVTREAVPRSIWALSFSADGRVLASAFRKPGGANIPNGAGAYVWRWGDPDGGRALARTDVYTARFAPAGSALAVTARERALFYPDPTTDAAPVGYPLQCEWAAGLAFVPPGDTAVVAAGSFLHFLCATEARKPRKVKTGLRSVSCVAVTPDGRSVLAGGGSGGGVKRLEVYDAESGALRTAYDFGVGSVYDVAVAPDGLTVAVAGHEGLAVCDADFA